MYCTGVHIGIYIINSTNFYNVLKWTNMLLTANTPEVFVLHLQVALYSLFQRLYGMYPCSFIAFISKFCSSKENIHVYEEIIMVGSRSVGSGQCWVSHYLKLNLGPPPPQDTCCPSPDL